jgi:anti-sigma B factor antagonist
VSLDIQQREREGIVLLECKGRIVAGGETAEFRAETERVLAEGQINLILDLEGIDFIDSTGLGAMVMASSAVRKKGGKVKLLHLNKRHVELLVITKLTTMFEMYDDEQDAVNSFFPGRQVRSFDLLSFIQEMKKE